MGRVERPAQQFAALAHWPHPAHHEDREAQPSARFITREPAPINQIAAQTAKSITSGIVAKTRPRHAPEVGIEQAGGVAVAILQAQADRFANGQAGEVQIRLHRRREEFAQRIEGGPRGRILHQRQVDHLLDTAPAQPGPDLLIFVAHLNIVRTRWPIDADLTQKGQTHRHRPVTAIEQQVDIHLHARHRRALDGGHGALGQCRQARVGKLQLAGEKFALGTVQLQSETQFMPTVITLLAQQFCAGAQIGQC